MIDEQQFERLMTALISKTPPQPEARGIAADIVMRIATGVTTFTVTGIVLFLININSGIKLQSQELINQKEARISGETRLLEKIDEIKTGFQKRLEVAEGKLSEARFTESIYAQREKPQQAAIIQNRELANINAQEIDAVKDDIRNITEDVRFIRMVVDPENRPKLKIGN